MNVQISSSGGGSSSSISFHLNGEQYIVKNGQFEITTSLNEYIRDVAGCKGTKIMCREAGCGVCIVTVTMFDPAVQKDRTFSINSCLCPLYSVDGWHIVTVEGIGNQRVGFHPIQERVAKFNGSQCGYCTPGMVMNMYGLLHDNATPSREEVESAFDGNICRCTGYRPILDAMKSFASDSQDADNKPIDIEDLNKFCPKTGQACANGAVVSNGAGQGDRADNSPLAITHGNVKWFRPQDLTGLSTLLKKHQRDKMRLLFGNTSAGVYKNDGPFNVYIDLHGIDELYKIEVSDHVVIGANNSLSSLNKQLLEISSRDEGSYKYFTALSKHILKIGNLPMRNAGSWAGNLMMKQVHKDFPSDFFTMMEAAGAQVEVLDALTDARKTHPMVDILSLNMTGKVILALKLFKQDDKDQFRSFKVMPRSQNAHAYTNAGFRFKIDPQSKQVLGKPSIVIGGINATFNHAVKTENFLVGRKLKDPAVVKHCLDTLRSEMKPVVDPVLASLEYRRDLAVNLLYKFILGVIKDTLDQRCTSGADQLLRPVSSGQQDFETHEEEFPMKKPITKILAPLQASGEAQYISDFPEQLGELHAAFVLSSMGNAAIESFDSSPALAMPGVVRFVCAKDIPGDNNMLGFLGKEEILASERVNYVGQPVGLIVADTHTHAVAAAKQVKIRYKDVGPVVVTMKEGIARGSFLPCQLPDVVVGDVDGTMASVPHTLEGEVSMGHQYHFYMENPVTLVCPNEDSYDVYSATQWADLTQFVCAAAIGKPVNSINVSVARVGGAFGGKATRSQNISSAAAICAVLTGRPVRLNADLQDNMEFTGKRFPLLAKYKVGYDGQGKLLALDATLYQDCGYIGPEANYSMPGILSHMDGGYFCPNVRLHPIFVKTNTAQNSFCRGPGPLPAGMVVETIVEHVAKVLNKDPIMCKELNLYEQGQSDFDGISMDFGRLRRIWQELKESAEVEKRQQEIKEFNKANRWKKRGLAMTPGKYGIHWKGGGFIVYVAIYKDGTVAVSHGGTEMGQGIHTKVAQAVAATLDIPVEFVKVKATNQLIAANSYATGGSVGSELNAKAAIECCKILKERIDKVRGKSDDPWQKVILTCAFAGVDLTAKYRYEGQSEDKFRYYTYVAGVTECELDVLTGEQEIRRVDMLCDLGQSLNPTIDIGQIEGAVVMGLGYWLSEELIHDPKTGRLLNNSTWEYKPPTTKDIPIDWRIKLLRNASNPNGLLGSKASGEPPILVSTGVVFALKRAIEAAREDLEGDTSFFPIDDLPLTVEKRQQLCQVSPANLSLDIEAKL